ncbi:MAG: preprotein translocase subunit SecE [Microcystis wesenbergii Mw_QC_S_20081001_S30D]|uniref:Protein translocase subunit SecE n=1 Tax=Microcystis wesenbergii Mw_QC_S_20081001_S30D TaxID=2486245 RepID=A0A552JP93_9CHRO|nr:preprotein translocase subunit SecE [Microcystis aeruginosa W11-03]NCR95178.1 preprotein translocase subunit SecE [Microcystis aeruginosa W11-06]TRU95429.1 MAG: preprotein translocase subunit SecE [Microcystis wesenbergii Mw_QC_B_20070930_S4D]TRU97539.1 MAG: preprotein translocase subunit SecE [Microcystis wesenbergii Mw_QC_S_20081001_S30D]TRV00198.1 MAG: preprotein translocase subunit SecE [Microcystis wesenbergii Mw_QC_S_20081001_S30]TRV15023.1 MAG: preprotein translocase subunit SecE [Mi
MAKKETLEKDTSDKKEGNSFQVKEFVNETKEELAKVVWPSRQQLLSESAAVMLMVTLVATLIYLIDKFFAWGAGKVFP